MIQTNLNWYNIGITEVISKLESSKEGITSDKAKERIKEFGPNELAKARRGSAFSLLLRQFANFLIIILLVATILSAIVGETMDAIVILIVIIFAVILGFIQEYKAERAIEALKKMSAPTTSVLRDGKETKIDSKDLVPGDVIIIRTGDKISADARIIAVSNLKVDEASLTGESVPVGKEDNVIAEEVSIGDRKNMIFMGTSAVYGRGTAIVTATGMATEFGKIASALQEVKSETTPLQINLDRAGKSIAVVALALCFILATIGVIRGHKILEMLIWGVSLAVAAVPESLPAVVTICLAIGVQRMLKRNALIRKLHAVETLGCTTVICSDKTGTLTQDQMTVKQIYTDGKLIDVTGSGYEPKGEFIISGTNKSININQEKALKLLLQAGILCNDASLELIDGMWHSKGDPTEAALVVIGEKAGLNHNELINQFKRVEEIPFSSETKKMITVNVLPEGKTAYSKGAPEVILNSCKYLINNGEEQILTPEFREKIREAGHNMANNALRVLGVSYKKLTDSNIENDMVFIGLAGMIDPPREEVKSAIKLCDKANIRSLMITGDHKLTAMAIAKELGLIKEGIAVSGEELDKINDKEFSTLVEKIEVYARVSPAHKLRVVEALTQKGHVVAMTGDGVNDAPALKRADIGIAMGKTGTDVTKEVADMVLLDDNFASIVAAVEEGRGIFSNIKKFLVYILSCNLGEVLLMAITILFGTFLGLPAGILPLIAIQILFVNLVTDSLPAIALALEPIEKDIMHYKPRRRKESIFTKSTLLYLACAGVWTAAVSLGVFVWAIKSGQHTIEEAQGLCFIALILVQFFNALNCRSLKNPIFKIGLFTNKWLWLALLISLLFTLSIFYFPGLQNIFHTYSLSKNDWLITISASATIFIAVELVKVIMKVFSLKKKLHFS